MKKEQGPINVYWAPNSVAEDDGAIGNWNMLYEDPVNVFKYWTQFDIKSKTKEGDSFIKCPAFQNLSKNIYAFKFPIDSSYKYKAHSKNVNQIEIIPTSHQSRWSRIIS